MEFSCRELNKKYIPITFKLFIANNTPSVYNNDAIKRRIILYEFPHSPIVGSCGES